MHVSPSHVFTSFQECRGAPCARRATNARVCGLTLAAVGVATTVAVTRLSAEPTPPAVALSIVFAGDASGRTPSARAADPDQCDFKTRQCKVVEGEPINFEIFFTNSNPFLEFCVFAVPETLPPGASFPAKRGMSRVGSEFNWTAHECQAGTYRVFFFGSFDCFNPLGAALFSVTITVNDAVACEVIGACCKPDGACENLSEEACFRADGFFDPDRLCKEVAGDPQCPIGIGACCHPGGTCEDMTERNCTIVSFGEFRGAGTRCAQTDPPLVCTGACCKNDFTCQNGLTKAACENQPTRGEFRGAGTVCGEIPPCSGACCFPDGACFHLPHRLDCLRRLGDFKGRNTECAHLGGNVTCPVTGGSCCVPNPEMCIVAGHTRCGLSGGTTVAPDPCPTPGGKCPPATGACCVFTGLSRIGGPPFDCRDGVTIVECLNNFPGSGERDYLGDGSKCGDDDNDDVDNCIDQCPNTPPGEPVEVELSPLGCSCTQIPSICDDREPCTQDICAPRSSGANSLGCIYRPRAGCCHADADCNDNDACTNDFCVQNACGHVTTNCEDDGIPCTVDRCDRLLGCNFPIHELCEDGDRCTANFCTRGVGCESFTVDCSDDVPCTRDGCDLQAGCFHIPVHERCDDNDPCKTAACLPNDPRAESDGCVVIPDRPGRPCGNGDVNLNGVVDLRDHSFVVGCLERSGPFTPVNTECPPADRDGDGDVDLFDLRFAFNDPFDCDPAGCQTVQGGVCATRCPEKEECVPNALQVDGSGEFSESHDAVVAGTDETSACTCRREQDCRVGLCETCVIPPGETRGVCKSRCERANCERCVDGLCRPQCVAEACQECRDGQCASTCVAGERCVRVPGLLAGRCFPECATPDDCPPCNLCVPTVVEGRRACVPCGAFGRVCRGDVCVRRCETNSQCAVCERCEEGVCVNDCPPGKTCDGVSRCRDQCAADTDCPNCHKCISISGVEGRVCVDCTDALQCLECGATGQCRPRCNANECQTCRSLACRVRCILMTERCDGAGNCVPR